MASKVILAAVDFSSESRAFVEWLANTVLKPEQQLRVLVVAAERQGVYSDTCLPPCPDEKQSQVEAARVACLHQFPQAHGAEVMVVPSGSCEAIGEAILRRARELRVFMLAIAPHPRTAMERVLKGSCTDYCLRHGRLPVLVVQGISGGGSELGLQRDA